MSVILDTLVETCYNTRDIGNGQYLKKSIMMPTHCIIRLIVHRLCSESSVLYDVDMKAFMGYKKPLTKRRLI